jgi:hypothetical protein
MNVKDEIFENLQDIVIKEPKRIKDIFPDLMKNIKKRKVIEVFEKVNRNKIQRLLHPINNKLKLPKSQEKISSLLMRCFRLVLDEHRSSNMTFRGYKKVAVDKISHLYNELNQDPTQSVSRYLISKLFKVLRIHRKSVNDLFSCDKCNPSWKKNIDHEIGILDHRCQMFHFITCCKIMKINIPKPIIKMICNLIGKIDLLSSHLKKHKIFQQYLFDPVRRGIDNKDLFSVKLDQKQQNLLYYETIERMINKKMDYEIHQMKNIYQRSIFHKQIKELGDRSMVAVLDWTLFETRKEKKGRLLTITCITKSKESDDIKDYEINYHDYFFQDHTVNVNDHLKPPKMEYLHTAITDLYENVLKGKIDKIDFWSDRGSADFMNTKTIDYFFNLKNTLFKDIEYTVNTYESKHGHNLCDGHFGKGNKK